MTRLEHHASMPHNVTIVGLGVAGVSTAEHLRAMGYSGELRLFGEEMELAYERPPLSKEVLTGKWDPERTDFLSPERRSALSADVHLQTSAVSLDAESRTLTLSTKESVTFQHLVVATGVRARRTFSASESCVSVRTRREAIGLRDRLLKVSRAVVVGAGLLGLEVASSARALGLDVSVISRTSLPLENRIGRIAAEKLAAVHRQAGVDTIVEADVATISSNGVSSAATVQLVDGRHIDTDIVFEAVGAEPNTEWLLGNGLVLDDGVRCDQYGSAGNSIWVAGDVAEFFHPYLRRHVRFEHRLNASTQPKHVAAGIMGKPTAYSPVPFLWTMQFGNRIQVLGELTSESRLVAGSTRSDSFALEFLEDGQVVGALAWNAPKELRPYQSLLQTRYSTELLAGQLPAVPTPLRST